MYNVNTDVSIDVIIYIVTADKAYREMRAMKMSQSVIVSGQYVCMYMECVYVYSSKWLLILISFMSNAQYSFM